MHVSHLQTGAVNTWNPEFPNSLEVSAFSDGKPKKTLWYEAVYSLQFRSLHSGGVHNKPDLRAVLQLLGLSDPNNSNRGLMSQVHLINLTSSAKKSLKTAQEPMAGEWELSMFTPIALCPPIEPSVPLVMHPSVYKCSELTVLVFGIPASPSPTKAQKKFLIIFWESTWKNLILVREETALLDTLHFARGCELQCTEDWPSSKSLLLPSGCTCHLPLLRAGQLSSQSCIQCRPKFASQLQLPACCHDNSKTSNETLGKRASCCTETSVKAAMGALPEWEVLGELPTPLLCSRRASLRSSEGLFHDEGSISAVEICRHRLKPCQSHVATSSRIS